MFLRCQKSGSKNQIVFGDTGHFLHGRAAAQPLVCRKNSVNVESLCACCGDESGATADLNPRRIAKKIQMNGVSASLLLDKMSL
jgi:hypothetical protein